MLPRADPHGEACERGAGDHREVREGEHAVPGVAQGDEDAQVVRRGERLALRVALHHREERDPGEADEDDGPDGERVRLEALGEDGAHHRERVECLLGEVVHLVVEDAEEHGRAHADRDRRMRAALVVAERDTARGGDDGGRGERDEVGA